MQAASAIRRRHAGRASEPEVAAYLRAAGPTPAAAALSEFVAGCKADGVWQRLDWVFPLLGRSLAAALVALKAPTGNPSLISTLLPSDYSESLGLNGNASGRLAGIPASLDGYLAGDFHLGTYVTAMNDANAQSFTSLSTGSPTRWIVPQYAGTAATSFLASFSFSGSGGGVTGAPRPDYLGWYMLNESGQDYSGWHRTRKICTGTQAPGTPASAGAVQQFCHGSIPIGLVTMGRALTDAQAAALALRVERLMIAAGRRRVRVYTDTDGAAICGQSLAIGADGTMIGGCTQAYGNLSPPLGPVNGLNTDFSTLEPLVENGQSVSSGFANSLRANGYPRPVFVGGQPVGSTAYAQMAKGTPSFQNTSTDHRAASGILSAAGASFRTLGMLCIHGEQDDVNDSTSYQADIAQWQSDYQAEIRSATGQSAAVPFFLSQMHSWTSYSNRSTPLSAIAQYNAWKANPSAMILVCPKYQFTYSPDDKVHLDDGYQYRWHGEYLAKAWWSTTQLGAAFLPLAPLSVSRSGATITAVMTRGGLVFDTSFVADPSGAYASRTYSAGYAAASTNTTATSYKGFEFMDDTAAAPSANITGIAIATTNIADDTLVIALSAAPTGANKRLRYAWTMTPGNVPGPATGARGCLRDSDASYPSIYGNDLYNWCVTFDEPAA